MEGIDWPDHEELYIEDKLDEAWIKGWEDYFKKKDKKQNDIL